MAYTLGKRIHDLRRARKLTIAQLAEKLDISPFAVSRWENGHTLPRIRLIPKIARALGVSVPKLWALQTKKERKR
jgi:transcriptional regulator with XRE-family HTH domain